ncbi:hypothetical protein [Pseudomonas fluorescens]|uniref:hypothetical protein n=1 Tax=Pseudomonas fluorescens TaxID=294 RepID=UPI0005FB5FEE|nr:hypothetical protein [Pseudomonas fluorescens]KJZ41352.1 hypothetical protein VC33_00460 [Pseudomonas fluorescens]
MTKDKTVTMSREQFSVPREFLEVIANSSERSLSEINAAIQKARQILAAPVVERQDPGYVLAKQTAVEVPGHERKDLGYTLFDGIGVFRSREEVHAAIAELGLPIGWVSMTVDQLLPGYMMPEDTSPPAPVAVVVPDDQTPYQPKGEWSFERLEGSEIVIRNGKDWTVIKSGKGPIYEQFLYRFCEQQMKELTAPTINENAEFEKWRNTQIDVLIRNGYPEGAEAFRNLGSVQWAGWQARACLDKVKEMNR